MSDNGGSRIFLSTDFGESFSQADLSFNPRMQIIYNPQNSNVLVTISVKVRERESCGTHFKTFYLLNPPCSLTGFVLGFIITYMFSSLSSTDGTRELLGLLLYILFPSLPSPPPPFLPIHPPSHSRVA